MNGKARRKAVSDKDMALPLTKTASQETGFQSHLQPTFDGKERIDFHEKSAFKQRFAIVVFCFLCFGAGVTQVWAQSSGSLSGRSLIRKGRPCRARP